MNENNFCGICGEKESEDIKLLKGLFGAKICKNCIIATYELLENKGDIEHSNMENLNKSKSKEIVKKNENNNFIDELTTKIILPNLFKEKLDEYIIGNDIPKKVLSVLIYNHYKKNIQIANSNNKEEYTKSNILLIGSTGTGKTLMAQTISRILGVPLAIADATSMTEAGYAGEDVSVLLSKLLKKADGDVQKAENGVVFIDEIDKIASKNNSNSSGRDISGEGVQQGLLKIIEGSIITVPSIDKSGNKIEVDINTENILFIAGGSFSGIEENINSRINKSSSIGFTSKNNSKEELHEILKKVEMEDIKSYGIIPELIGRLHVVTVLDDLTEDTYKRILLEPKNSLIKEYQRFYKSEGIKLKFSEEAINHIIKYAIEKKVGVRGLKSSIEDIMLDMNYNIEKYKNKNITVGKREVQKLLKIKSKN